MIAIRVGAAGVVVGTASALIFLLEFLTFRDVMTETFAVRTAYAFLLITGRISVGTVGRLGTAFGCLVTILAAVAAVAASRLGLVARIHGQLI